MRSPCAWLQIVLVGIALSDGTGCGGERLRLGDGTAAEDVITGGLAGQGGNTGGSSTGGFVATGGTVGGASDATGGSPEPACERGQTRGEEVLWIGDSWVTIPGTQHTRVAEHARNAGALGTNENYWIEAAAAKGIADIQLQYESREAGPIKVKVLIMNGGTWDTIVANGSDASIADVIAIFERFLDKIASDGTVEHVVYFLQPELPTIPGVARLRPELRRLCAQSSVPCHFVDLEPLWDGNEQAYTADNGIQASEAGARVIADAIWQVMQDNCIAQ